MKLSLLPILSLALVSLAIVGCVSKNSISVTDSNCESKAQLKSEALSDTEKENQIDYSRHGRGALARQRIAAE